MLIYRAPSFYSLRICCDRSCVSCRVSPLVVAPWASRLCKCVEASRVLHMCMMPVSSHPGGGGGGAAAAASASDGAGSRPLSVNSSNRVAMAPLTEGHRALLPPPGIEPHTLILGTHPSIESLKWAEYYGGLLLKHAVAPHPLGAYFTRLSPCACIRNIWHTFENQFCFRDHTDTHRHTHTHTHADTNYTYTQSSVTPNWYQNHTTVP